MTIREIAEFLTRHPDLVARGSGAQILQELNDSRETTEKKTHVYIDPAPGWIRDRYQVTNHKARVVLDD